MRKHRQRASKRLSSVVLVFAISLLTSYCSSRLFGSSSSVAITKEESAPIECAVEAIACETNVAKSEVAIWAIMNMLAVLYVFLALAIVCDDLFVASLEVICEELKLSPDVAGATFMAAGSSAPELFTSVVGVFYQKNDVGIGTILGSAVFNILVIIGLSALLAGQVLQLDWRIFARDSVFYMISIILMFLMFSNQRIDWYEPVIFLTFYAGYLVLMKFNPQLLKLLDHLFTKSAAPIVSDPLAHIAPGSLRRDDKPPSFRVVAQLVLANIRMQKIAQQQQAQRDLGSPQEAEESDSDGDMLDFPDTPKDQFLWILSLPWLLMFKITVPDCSKKQYRKYYALTFTMSVVWIGALCVFMTEWARSIGCLLNISPAVMGLTLLAAGTSVPDALSSLFVAQDGEGDMAVSNALGSNVFDILLGLGLPWAISMAITGGEPIAVCSEDILKSTMILFLVLVLVVGVLALSGWKLTPMVGGWMCAIYFVFVVYAVVDEYSDLI